jgi:hypothetical protein
MTNLRFGAAHGGESLTQSYNGNRRPAQERLVRGTLSGDHLFYAPSVRAVKEKPSAFNGASAWKEERRRRGLDLP